MSHLPRVALGTRQSSTDRLPILWALVGLLRGADRQVQIFHDRATFADADADRCICGQSARYLDSWLMDADLCRESFARGAGGSDFAIVEGCYQRRDAAGQTGAVPRDQHPMGEGSLDLLCQWLELPRLEVLDVSQMASCQLPPRPLGAAGVFLDRVREEDFFHWQTCLESLWGIPVLGGLPPLPKLRSALAGVDCGRSSCELCRELAAHLLPTCRLQQVLDIADQYEFSPVPQRVFTPGRRMAGVTIAVAFDEAFHCYFPDVLELLDLQGARVETFSPLRDESLPPGTDVLYLGCGHTDRYAQQLADNHCMLVDLRGQVCRGMRVYAEGGGMAYLCHSLMLPSGETLPMAGVLPAVAHCDRQAGPSIPKEITLARDTWLGRAGSKLRGYVNPRWRIERLGRLQACVAEAGCELHLVAHNAVIGSQMHVNFAAQPDFLRRFSSDVIHSLV